MLTLPSTPAESGRLRFAPSASVPTPVRPRHLCDQSAFTESAVTVGDFKLPAR